MTMTQTTKLCSVRALDGTEREFSGTLLGFGTSQLDTHIHPPGALPEGLRCSGCRWTEVRIWRSDSDNCYVIGTKGVTAVPGEENRYKNWWSNTAEGVLDVLLVAPPRKRALGKPEGFRELPAASYDAMEEASDKDTALLTVLDAWEAENIAS